VGWYSCFDDGTLNFMHAMLEGSHKHELGRCLRYTLLTLLTLWLPCSPLPHRLTSALVLICSAVWWAGTMHTAWY